MTRRRFDIRSYKRNLRAHYKQLRQAMPPQDKQQKDAEIFRLLSGMPQYRQAKTLLCFVSMQHEVDTHRLIRLALAEGKTVAVPYCLDGTRDMKFYSIESLDDLVPRTFGVLEPDPQRHAEVKNYADSICILPGLAFDAHGYRLGYGGGYYDRFLSSQYKKGVTIGVCYASCTRSSLTHGRYDVPCGYLVTESGVRRISHSRPPQRKKGKSP